MDNQEGCEAGLEKQMGRCIAGPHHCYAQMQKLNHNKDQRGTKNSLENKWASVSLALWIPGTSVACTIVNCFKRTLTMHCYARAPGAVEIMHELILLQ